MNLNSKMTDLLVANPFIYGAESVDSTSKPYLVNSAYPLESSIVFVFQPTSSLVCLVGLEIL
jgi:hypothetical protein